MTTNPRARRRALREALAARRDAQRLLDDLLIARRDTLQRLREAGRRDALASITGRTAFDDAIDQTRRLLERLSASLERTRKALVDNPIAVERAGAFDLASMDSESSPHVHALRRSRADHESERLALALGAD